MTVPLSPLALARAVVLAVAPHGGQQGSRRNAWAAMAADSQRGRARREAADALDLACRRAPSPTTGTAAARGGV